jgi:hypothetical protein
MKLEHSLSDRTSEGETAPALPEQLLRGLVTCAATPFLLLAVLVVGCWL